MTTFTIIVEPADQPGTFLAKIDGKLICKPRTPFCTVARVLIERGYPPGALLVMRHAGSDTDSLRATIAAAAKLAVRDDRQGRPRFVDYRPGPDERGREGCGGYPPIAPNDCPATPYAEAAE
jgi:hypothetical protein